MRQHRLRVRARRVVQRVEPLREQVERRCACARMSVGQRAKRGAIERLGRERRGPSLARASRCSSAVRRPSVVALARYQCSSAAKNGGGLPAHRAWTAPRAGPALLTRSSATRAMTRS